LKSLHVGDLLISPNKLKNAWQRARLLTASYCRYTNLATQFGFELNGTLNTCNYRNNYMFAEAVNSLLDSCSGYEATDFISVGDALEQVTQDLGITVSHSTVVSWVAIHGLGHKLEGMDAYYMQPSEENLKDAMEKFTNWLDGQLKNAIVDQTVDQANKF